MVRGLIAAVVGILLLAGCTDDTPGSADPTVPTAASTSTSTSTSTPQLDVASIPEKIDVPYLNAVLAALDEIDGEATRIIYETKRFTPEAADLLNTIYSDEAFQDESQGWLQSLASDAELKNIRPNPGSRETSIDRIIASSSSCVWMAVRRDYSARNFDAGPAQTEYVALVPLEAANDPRHVNRTPWMIAVDGFREDGREPSNPC